MVEPRRGIAGLGWASIRRAGSRRKRPLAWATPHPVEDIIVPDANRAQCGSAAVQHVGLSPAHRSPRPQPPLNTHVGGMLRLADAPSRTPRPPSSRLWRSIREGARPWIHHQEDPSWSARPSRPERPVATGNRASTCQTIPPSATRVPSGSREAGRHVELIGVSCGPLVTRQNGPSSAAIRSP
jgi:hypothetical protein